MKSFLTLYFVLLLLQSSFSQSIVIDNGALIEVQSGADLCAGAYGNITGQLTGGGTQCSQLPLPVELSLFIASVKDQKVNLYWKTETEVNNYGFEIERSINSNGEKNLNWKKIGFVSGSGNSNSEKNYSFTDSYPTGGSKFSYRLKQIDNDGSFEYSSVVEVELVPTKFELSQNYPNPFNLSTKIKYTIPNVSLSAVEGSRVQLKVYDVLGNEVANLVNDYKPAGSYEVEFDASKLSSGIYFYKLQAGSFTATKKMILLK
jgi:hypothetical protein